MPPSCALLGGFVIGARVALLWQHNANAKFQRVHACTNYTVSGRNGTTLFLPLTLPVLANFQYSFTNRLSSKFPAMLS